jgi:hypothetical protein
VTRWQARGRGRGDYRLEVSRLLERIGALTHRQGVLEAGGAPQGVLAAVELETARVRRQLAALIAARQAERSAPPARAAA